MIAIHRGLAWTTAGVLALAAAAFAIPARPFRLSVRWADDSVPMKDVPEAVRTTAGQRFGKLDACKASREKEHGKLRYEIEKPVEGGGLESLIISEAGDLMEIEKPVAAEALPKAVKDALAAAFPTATVALAETVEEHSYEVALKVEGKTRHVKVELDGAIPSAHAAAKPAEGKEKAEKAGKPKAEDDDDDD